ncbi:LRR repeats and ubiquitin-like domain-containing protein At2g30105 [Tasmannia lanceolata]|uniref:LRR repeats and ubiquitin-like domain-containing protein At2g30105 n=1 Tax=Tasmannia lanceolata TaxID=3420 RepID=UPI00406422CD
MQRHCHHNCQMGQRSCWWPLMVYTKGIDSVASCIGNCSSLIETLHLRNNGMKSFPSTLFKMCSQLSTLDLHGTEITMDLLRQFEGWEDFDEQRRSKHQKQLDFSVGCSSGFDEGAQMQMTILND